MQARVGNGRAAGAWQGQLQAQVCDVARSRGSYTSTLQPAAARAAGAVCRHSMPLLPEPAQPAGHTHLRCVPVVAADRHCCQGLRLAAREQRGAVHHARQRACLAADRAQLVGRAPVHPPAALQQQEQQQQWQQHT